jgi:hypothetical protein
MVSSLYYVRTQPLRLHAEQQLLINAVRTNYHVSFTPDQKKTLWLRPCGDVKALRVEPNPTLTIVSANKGHLWFWVSDDARHLPLLVATEIPMGTVKLVLFKIESTAPDLDKTGKRLGTAQGPTSNFRSADP